MGCGGGADILRRRLKAGLTYFAAELTDEIVGAGTTVVNQAGVSDRRGVELTLAAQVTPNWLITGSYAYTDATDLDGREEIRTPPHGASLGVHHTLAEGRAQIGATAIYNGRMKDDQFAGLFDLGSFVYTPVITRRELDDYLLVSLSASYRLNRNIELFGRVENLLDSDYEEVLGYSTAPISAVGGVRMTFEADGPLEAAMK